MTTYTIYPYADDTLAEIHRTLEVNRVYHLPNLINNAVDKANERLDDLTRLFQLRADYNWFKSYVLNIIPLGVGMTYVEERLIFQLAQAEGMMHVARALIDEFRSTSPGLQGVISRAITNAMSD
jgi:hypothetical protein